MVHTHQINLIVPIFPSISRPHSPHRISSHLCSSSLSLHSFRRRGQLDGPTRAYTQHAVRPNDVAFPFLQGLSREIDWNPKDLGSLAAPIAPFWPAVCPTPIICPSACQCHTLSAHKLQLYSCIGSGIHPCRPSARLSSSRRDCSVGRDETSPRPDSDLTSQRGPPPHFSSWPPPPTVYRLPPTALLVVQYTTPSWPFSLQFSA